MIGAARTDRTLVTEWWWTVDRWTVAALLCLIAMGIVLSFAASPAIAEHYDYTTFHFVVRTLIYMIPALVLMFGVSLMEPDDVKRLAFIIFGVSVVLMALTLFVGIEVKGARRWIKLGSFSLQASEFMKPAFVIVAAWAFAEHNRNGRFPGHLISGALLGIVGVLLVLQPDFGQLFLMVLIWGGLFFMAGISLPWIGALAFGGMAGAWAAYVYMPHVTSRIDRFINPDSGDTYQVDKALEAFRSGGVTGVGPGEGLVKHNIPDAHTDFIFAVAGEEFGIIACLLLVGVFCFIVMRCFRRAIASDDHFVQLAAGGLVSLFGLQALINLGVNLQLLPAKGMTLPFVSYGGSSLLSMALAMGMLLALTRRWARCDVYVESGA